MEIPKDKTSLRREFLSRRNTLTQDEIFCKSKVIQNRVTSSREFQSARNIGVYWAIGSEVRTENIIRLALKSKERVGLPILNDHILFYGVSNTISDKELISGRFGTKEPSRLVNVSGDIDLLIVPGIVFDLQGYRIGYGRGYYDKFITTYRKVCELFTIGIAYDSQMLNSGIPHDSLDERMDMVITEKRILGPF
jgi:5-formyltetrahydrofolate cyclo-ligase